MSVTQRQLSSAIATSAARYVVNHSPIGQEVRDSRIAPTLIPKIKILAVNAQMAMVKNQYCDWFSKLVSHGAAAGLGFSWERQGAAQLNHTHTLYSLD